ncbi:MAG: DNA-binding response regulator, partial [Candidatus Rokuibacteriota bacterium]
MATTILLIEDHAIVRQGVRVLLEREGHQVLGEAADGHEGVRLAGELGPDLA